MKLFSAVVAIFLFSFGLYCEQNPKSTKKISDEFAEDEFAENDTISSQQSNDITTSEDNYE